MSLAKEHAAPKDLISHGFYVKKILTGGHAGAYNYVLS